VIESFWHRGLRELFETGKSARVRPDLHRRILVRLDAIDKAASLAALSQPGFDFHPLGGTVPRALLDPRQRPVVHHLRVA
jgi:proteic killer suppression protein